MDDGDTEHPHELVVRLDDFAWEALSEEARCLGVSEEELARFALVYYLADVDSGRMTRRLPSPLAMS